MRRISIAIAAILFCPGIAPPLPAGGPTADRTPRAAATSDAGNIIAEVELAKSCGLLIVPVTMDGQEYPFVVDTGSSICFIDTSLRALVHETGRRASINGKKGFDIYRLPEVLLGQFRIPAEMEATCCDLTWFRILLGHDIRGILGMNVLKAHVVRVDFDAGNVQFLKQSPKSADAEFAISYGADGVPIIETRILTGKSRPFYVDSGFTLAGEITARTFAELREQGRLTDVRIAYSLKIDGFRLSRQASINVSQPAQFERRQLQFSPGEYDVLGLGFLSAYDVTFDFPNDCLYLRRGKRLAESLGESKSESHSEYERVIANYCESTRLDPKDANGFIVRSRELFEKRQFRKAIADCTKAIRLNPMSSSAYLIRGEARAKMGDDRALSDFAEAGRLMREFADFCDALELVR